jgi:hypothetical protein
MWHETPNLAVNVAFIFMFAFLCKIAFFSASGPPASASDDVTIRL